jgi:hypothetical protein
MALNIILAILSFILVIYGWIFFFQSIGWFFARKLGGKLDIFPLDVIDASELTEMVDTQVKEYITPLLQSKGYSEDKIKEILTVKPIGSNRTFKR